MLKNIKQDETIKLKDFENLENKIKMLEESIDHQNIYLEQKSDKEIDSS